MWKNLSSRSTTSLPAARADGIVAARSLTKIRVQLVQLVQLVQQPGDVVMVRTDGFVGKRKVKDRWEDGGFIDDSQLGDWPVYKVRCPSADDRQKPKYRILHRNRLLLVADEDVDDASGQAQAKATPTLPNATHEALSVGVSSQEPLPSLVTRQGGELTSMVWLNGEFRTKPWTQVVSLATPSPPDLHVDEVSGDESTEPEGT